MDQSDPRCPECGEPISATATWCMHCHADVGGGATPDSDDGPAGATGVPADGERRDSDRTRRTGETDADAGDAPLDPDGFADDSLTVLVGLVAGAVVGLLALVVALFTTQSAWGFLFGLVVWLGATARLVRRRTVFDALQEGCYATAALLVCVPFIALGPGAEGGTFAGQVVLFLIAEVPFGLGAALVTGVGYWLGRKAPAAD